MFSGPRNTRDQYRVERGRGAALLLALLFAEVATENRRYKTDPVQTDSVGLPVVQAWPTDRTYPSDF